MKPRLTDAILYPLLISLKFSDKKCTLEKKRKTQNIKKNVEFFFFFRLHKGNKYKAYKSPNRPSFSGRFCRLFNTFLNNDDSRHWISWTSSSSYLCWWLIGVTTLWSGKTCIVLFGVKKEKKEESDGTKRCMVVHFKLCACWICVWTCVMNWSYINKLNQTDVGYWNWMDLSHVAIDPETCCNCRRYGVGCYSLLFYEYCERPI